MTALDGWETLALRGTIAKMALYTRDVAMAMHHGSKR
jgi:hypothetical protein